MRFSAILLFFTCAVFTMCRASGKDGFLYVIYGNEEMPPSYLIGSQHGDGNSYNIYDLESAFPSLQAVFASINLIVTETSRNYSDTKVIEDCVNAAELRYTCNNPNILNSMPKGTDYKGVLRNNAKYKEIDNFLKNKGGIYGYAAFKPAYWYLRLPLFSYKYGADMISVDDCLYKFARSQNKKATSLESHVEQMQSIVSILNDTIEYMRPLCEQANILYEKIVESQHSIINQVWASDSMKFCYLHNNKEKLYHYLPHLKDSVIYKYSVSQRNEKWGTIIEKLIRNEPCLIVVGVAHLYGYDSLVEILRRKGLKLIPIQ